MRIKIMIVIIIKTTKLNSFTDNILKHILKSINITTSNSQKQLHIRNKYPSKKEDWKRSEQNNPIIALNVLYILLICPVYISKKKSNCKNQMIL